MTISKWWRAAQNEIRALLDAPDASPVPGLYTYPVSLPGGHRRIHLRIDSAGAGVLFVDVTDVIHLNATATRMAKLALDGVPRAQAERQLRREFAGVTPQQLAREVEDVYRIVEGLREAPGCPTCTIFDRLVQRPIFSTPVSAPFKADLALTYSCNNACSHCYNEADRLTMASLPERGWFAILEKLAEIGVPHIILTGGEPTLHPQLAAIVRHANALGQIVGMNTNGRALSYRPLAEQLAESGLNHVQITLESSREDVHNRMVNADAFHQTLAGIRNCLESGIHTITNTTLTRQNLGHAIEIVDFLHRLGLQTFAMNGMIYAGGGLDEPDAIPAEDLAATLVAVRDRAEELGMRFLWYTVTDYCRLSPLALDLAPKRCNAAEYSICVEPNGDVLPCQSYYSAAGNLLTDPWDEIWNSALFRSFREREQNPEQAGLPEMCLDCPDLEMCGGGCRLEHEAHSSARPAERGCARARVSAAQETVTSAPSLR